MPTKTTDDEATTVESPDVRSLARRSLSSVREAADPRITPSDRPADAVLDEGYLRQLHDHRHSEKHIASEKKTNEEESQDTSNEIIYVRSLIVHDVLFADCNDFYCTQVDFEEGDPRDPANFTYARKWAITVTASFFSIITGKCLCAYSE